MKKLTYGTPEKLVPTRFCKNLNVCETEVKYDTNQIQFQETPRGCMLEFRFRPENRFTDSDCS